MINTHFFFQKFPLKTKSLLTKFKISFFFKLTCVKIPISQSIFFSKDITFLSNHLQSTGNSLTIISSSRSFLSKPFPFPVIQKYLNFQILPLSPIMSSVTNLSITFIYINHLLSYSLRMLCPCPLPSLQI